MYVAGMVLLFAASFLLIAALPVRADLLDVYESDGILRDLIVLEGDLVENAIRINAQIMAQTLIDRSDLIADAANSQQTAIVSAYYHLETGQVEVL